MAMLVAYALGAFFTGRLADRHGPRGTLLGAASLIALGFVGCSLARDLASMTLSYAAIGLGTGATLSLPTATIQRWFVRWRGLMVGIVVAGTGLGAFIFAPLTDYLIAQYGWRAAYSVIALVYGGVIAIAASFLISEPRMKGLRPFGDGEGQPGKPALRIPKVSPSELTAAQAFRSGAFWGLAAISVLSFMPSFFLNAHLVPYATDREIAAADGARAVGMIGLASVAGRLALTLAAGKMGWMRVLALCYAVAAASVIWLMFSADLPGLYLFAGIYGFFWGSTLALFGGAVSSFFGLKALSELLGLLLGLSVLGGAVAPFLGGLSFDLTGSYLTALVLAAFSFAAAAIFSFLLKPPKAPGVG
ncbi:MAG: MFS transporter, partial [Chloroflexota bacterium]|nr:MFS transporter [Chloroflexota bacterium]